VKYALIEVDHVRDTCFANLLAMFLSKALLFDVFNLSKDCDLYVSGSIMLIQTFINIGILGRKIHHGTI